MYIHIYSNVYSNTLVDCGFITASFWKVDMFGEQPQPVELMERMVAVLCYNIIQEALSTRKDIS